MFLYLEATKIVEAIKNKNGSIKSLVQASKFKNKKALLALVSESIKYDKLICDVMESTQFLKHEYKTFKGSSTLSSLVIYDFLIGKGMKSASEKVQKSILKHKSALHSSLERIKVKANVSSVKQLLSDEQKIAENLPRYVRVNLLKSSIDDVITYFRKVGFKLLCSDGLSYEGFKDAILSMNKKEFIKDIHLDDLLVFTPGTDLHENVLYKSGDIILQDKASCLPAHILNPPPGSSVIDCCAAPGNKTTHLAALMNNRGKIYAFDKDAKRASTLNILSLQAGALCIDTCHKDFFTVDPLDSKYSAVKYILVDPSCSGSGIIGRGSVSEDNADELKIRLKKLSSFQEMILSHALKFPNVLKVVYSTCSIHKEENEDVVMNVLSKFQNFCLSNCLPNFPSRGLKNVTSAELCIRCSTSNDFTHGFFVACLEKKQTNSNHKEIVQNDDKVTLLGNTNDIDDCNLFTSKNIDIEKLNEVFTNSPAIMQKIKNKKKKKKSKKSKPL